MNPSRGGKARPGRPRKTTPGSAAPVTQAADFMESVTPTQSPNYANDRTPQTVPQDRKVSGPRKQSYPSRLTPGGHKLIAEEREKDRQRKDTWGSSFSEGEDFDDANREANRKGGHSLRKRARVDYSSEYIDDELGARSKAQPTPAPRGRKRKSGIDDDLDHETGHVHRRRATENWRSDPSPRRKYPARRSIGPGSYAELADEKDALDTIEVGGRVQFDDSPEQAEEQEYRDATPPSPSPKTEPKKEPERFLIGIPIPASLMTGDVRLPGFTKSPDIFEASAHAAPVPEETVSPKQMPAAEAEAGQEDAGIPPNIDGEGTKADTSSDQVASAQAEPTPAAPEKEEAAPVEVAPKEASQRAPSDTAPTDTKPVVPEPAEAVMKDAVPAVAEQPETAPTEAASVEPEVSSHLISSVKTDTRPESSARDEAELQKQGSPAKEETQLHTRRNSAPGLPSPAPITSGSTDAVDLLGRRWKEFEDLEPTSGPVSAITLQEIEPALDAKTADSGIKTVEAVEVVEAVGTPGPALEPAPKLEAIPELILTPAVESEAMPETAPVAIPESKPEALPEPAPRPIMVPESMLVSEPEAISEPVPEPSPSLQVDGATEARESSASESFQEATEARESSSSESFQDATEAAEATELEPPVDVTASTEDQFPKGSKVHIIAIETTDKTIEPIVETKSSAPAKPWSHLTPHVAGLWTMQPESRLPQATQANDSFTSKGSSTPSTKAAETNGEPAVNGDNADVPHEMDEDGDEPIESVAVSPRAETPTMGSPVPELNHATAADSPAADEDDEAVDEVEEVSEGPPQTQRFYKYPRLRDPDEFGDVIQHFKDMPTEDLYEMCGFVDETLVALQKEYLMLGAIVDDFENVERRKAHDEAYEQLEKRGAKVSRKTFVLKGYRAPMTEEEKETAYQRHQDRIQAAAYGFRYDSHQSKVGKQDPALQRLIGGSDDGEPRRTLRSDPSRSAKATEAADEVPAVPGKRVRRPRELFDPVAATSRGSTPVPTRRKRGGRATSADVEDSPINGVDHNGHLGNGVSHPLASSFSQPEKPKRGRKREAEPAGHEVGEGAMLPPPPPKRIRRASTKAQLAAEEGHVVGHEHQAVFPATPLAPAPPATPVETFAESVESPPKKRIVTLKTKAKSFRALSRALAAAAPADSSAQEERPTTSSSTNSSGAGDWSAYRQKRRRKTRDYDDEEADYEEGGPGVQKAKRARKVTKKAEESVADNTLQLPSIHDGVVPEYHHQHQPGHHQGPSGAQATPAKGRIRLVKPGGSVAGGASVAVAPAAASPVGANGVPVVEDAATKKKRKAAQKAKQLEEAQGELSAQEYAALSKSEKMSHSMKSRWASGSMQQAVDKRKATLAKKKAAKAAGPPGTADGSPEANSEEGKEVEVGAGGVGAAV
ncbi:uncharacterized protein DNG_05178 [Cephalotrichum gorgonifer]|uniref:Uncharacterized protein n=1 Tax=Cephalotrichum gorgonifer TaxID=2041049 RepID=A0AAE8SV90_9PEZI|nr:uncharacterized protein DNG_05178 [Cephalotrichum gorgonifer]